MISAILLAANLQADLDSILDSAPLKGAQVGLLVTDSQGRVLYERDAETRVIPASNQKILSTAYAIGVLGPEATLQTRIWRTADGAMVDAPGDPTLTSADLSRIGGELKLPAGSMVVARQAFRAGTPPSWEWDDLPFTYAPQITALTVDQGVWSLAAEQGRLIPPPSAYGIKLQTRGGDGNPRVRYNPWLAKADVFGRLPQARTALGRFALPDPDIAAAGLLGGRLVNFPGATLPNRAPDFTLTSPPIRLLIKSCLEPSDNQIAEHLMLLTAARQAPLPNEPYGDAAERMNAFLTQAAGLEAGDLRPRDGSGLSRQNLLTPRSVVAILRWTQNQPWAAEYREALAAGGEGTLRNRLRTGNFIGKTGTINAVSSLSGILNPGLPNERYVSIIFNSAPGPSAALRQIQDRIVEAIAQDAADELSTNPAVEASRHADPSHRPADVRRIP
ncbi:MAG: D-alanyl-D-alanine carboxypeptidase [Fimbriimonadaceae bacterium]|nr:D-alanyl-D-alanine carboxypeptidase [Fimbriimonadaceae bacterium]